MDWCSDLKKSSGHRDCFRQIATTEIVTIELLHLRINFENIYFDGSECRICGICGNPETRPIAALVWPAEVIYEEESRTLKVTGVPEKATGIFLRFNPINAIEARFGLC